MEGDKDEALIKAIMLRREVYDKRHFLNAS